MEVLADAQRSALLSLLRLVATSEDKAEHLRCRLCETICFDPYESFKSMQSEWNNQKGWITAVELRAWVSRQPNYLSCLLADDVMAALAPFVNEAHELTYEGFLRLTLPKDPCHVALKEMAFSRGGQLQLHVYKDQYVSADVTNRLCAIVENEVDMHRSLKLYQRTLKELAVSEKAVLKFLDSQQGACAGMGGLISPSAMREALVGRVCALTPCQFESLLRRVNPSGACLVAFSDLSKYLNLPLFQLSCSPIRFSPMVSSLAYDYSPFRIRGVPFLLRKHDGDLVDNSQLKSQLAGITCRKSKNSDDKGERVIDFGSTIDGTVEYSEDDIEWPKLKTEVPSADAVRVPQRMVEEAAVLDGVWMDSSNRHLLTVVQIRNVWKTTVRGKEVQGTIRDSLIEITNPTEWRCSGMLDGNVISWSLGPTSKTWTKQLSAASPLKGPAPAITMTEFVATEGQANPRSALSPRYGSSVPLTPRRSSLPSTPRRTIKFADQASPRSASPPRYGSSVPLTPRRMSDSFLSSIDYSLRDTPRESFPGFRDHREKSPISPGMASTNASTADLRSSPSRHSPRASTPDSFSYSNLGSPVRHEPRSPSPPHQAWSLLVPPEVPQLDGRRSSSMRSLRLSPRSSFCTVPLSTTRRENVRNVLQVMLSQADADSHAEDAKVLLPSTCTPSAVFKMLDRQGKGYVTDTDLWQFAQDLGARVSFGSVNTLMRDLQSRDGQDHLSTPGRFTLRDIGKLILRHGSNELQALLFARTDNEAWRSQAFFRTDPTRRSLDTRFAAEESLDGTHKYYFYRLLEVAANKALSLDADRRRLFDFGRDMDMARLSEVFDCLSGGHVSIRLSDLRKAFFDHTVFLSEGELQMLWSRYSPNGIGVTFFDFANQLKPRGATTW